MPLIQNRLPKVTEYAINFGKSVGYAVIEDMKQNTAPNMAGFLEDNQELFRDIASAAKNYKRTMMMADRSIKRSKVYEAGQELKKNLFDSLRTGKFYDIERQNSAFDRAGGSLGDMSDLDSDFDFNSDAFDVRDDTDTEMRSASVISNTVEYASKAQSQVIARSAEYLAETQNASAKLLFTQGEKMYAAVTNGMANTQAMLATVQNFLDGPLTAHMTNSQMFYEKTQSQLDTIIGMLKETTEIQRNLYKKEQEAYKDSGMRKVGYNTPNLAEYGKQISKNLKEYLGPEFDMLFGDSMGDGNMLLTLVANPLAILPETISKVLVPRVIKSSIESIDETVDGVFANLMARLSKMGDESFDNPIAEFFGKVFGLKANKKTTVDTTRYTKGPVPFDGITRKSIVEVIPGHLARIEAALTGRSERVFDYERGKWTDYKEMEKDRKREEKNKYASSMPTYDIERYLAELEKHNKKQAEEQRRKFNLIMKKIYDDGYFEPYRTHGRGDDKQTAAEYYLPEDAGDTFELFTRLMARDRNGMKRIAASIARDKDYRSQRMHDMEMQGLGAGAAYNYHNNAYYDRYDEKEKKRVHSAVGMRNLITEATDRHGMNLFDYLRELRDDVRFIRENRGGYGKRGKRGKGPKGPAGGPSPIPTSGGSGDDAYTDALTGGSFDIDTFNAHWDDQLLIDEAARAAARPGAKQDKAQSVFLARLLEAGSAGERFKVISNGLAELTKKPGLVVSGILDKADQRLYNMLFGDPTKEQIVDDEDDGKSIRGIMDYMVFKIRSTFDRLDDWLEENIFDPLKDKLGVNSMGDFFKLMIDKMGLRGPWESIKGKASQLWYDTRDRLKDKFGWGATTVKNALNNTYGRTKTVRNMRERAYDRMTEKYGYASEAMTDSRIIPTAVPQTREELDELYAMSANPFVNTDDGVNYDLLAHGGLITKRGLVMVSPGERIIPAGGKNTQRRMLTEEKTLARKMGLGRFRFMAGGSANPVITDPRLAGGLENGPAHKAGVSNGSDYEKVKKTVETVTSEVMGDTEHKGIANVIASGLIGSGVSLLTGLIGGPLLGAAVGSGFGIMQNSESVRKMLFGEDLTDSEGNVQHKEGVIPKKVQDAFHKYMPSMRDFGIAGAVTGLFTPFGLVGGLMIGGAVGFAKENDKVQDWLFGEKDKKTGERIDNGVIKKEFKEKLQKAAPRMATGALAGVLFGPGGFLLNAALGSALGFATTTDQFHEFIFGKETENGEKYGGLVGYMKNGFMKPMLSFGKWLYDDATIFVKKHVFSPLKDFGIAIKDMFQNAITDMFNGIQDFMADMFEKTIGRPLGEWFQHAILDRATKMFMGMIKMPYNLAKGAIAAPAHLLGAIGKGIRSRQIAKGSAHGMTAESRLKWRRDHKISSGLNRFLGWDKSLGFDFELSQMKGQEGIEKMKQMQGLMDDYLDNSRVGSKAANLINKCGEDIRKYLETNTMNTGDGFEVPLYFFLGSGIVKTIKKKIASGKCKDAEDLMHLGKMMKVPLEHKEGLKSIINGYLPEINQAIAERAATQKDRKGAMKQLNRLSGGLIKNRATLRRARGLVGDQIKALEDKEKMTEVEKKEFEEKNPELVVLNKFREGVEQRTDSIIQVLMRINTKIGGSNEGIAGVTKDTNPADANKTDGVAGATPTRPRIRMTGVVGHLPQVSDAMPADDTDGSSGGIRSKIAGKAHEIGEAIIGKKNALLKRIKGSFNTIEGQNGEIGLVDSDGNAVDNNAKDIQKENKKNNTGERIAELTKEVETTNKGLFGKFKDKIGGALSKTGGFLGSIVSGFTKGGGVLGGVLGFAGGIAKAIFAMTAIGHFSQFWKDKIAPVLGPIWEDKIKPAIMNIGAGIKDFLSENAPGVHDFLFGNEANGTTGIFAKIGNFFTDPFKAIFEWSKDGLGYFQKNILKPILGTVWNSLNDKLPMLITTIKNAWFGTGKEDNKDDPFQFGSSEKIQAKDDNGNALYYDKDGNQTTEAGYYDASGNWVDNDPVYSATKLNKQTGIMSVVSKITGIGAPKGNYDSQIVPEETDKAGRKFKLYENDGRTGHHTIKCMDTDEYVRILDNGHVGYGFTFKNTTNQVSKGRELGGIAGFILGTGITIAAIAAAVGSGGSLAAPAASALKIGGTLILKSGVVLLGGLAGSMLGKWVGTDVGLIVYELADGNYACEFITDRNNTAEATTILQMFGWTSKVKSVTDWPDFSQQTSGDTISASSYKSTMNPISYFTGTTDSYTTFTGTTNATDGSAAVIEHDLVNYSKYSSSTAGPGGMDGILNVNNKEYYIYNKKYAIEKEYWQDLMSKQVNGSIDPKKFFKDTYEYIVDKDGEAVAKERFPSIYKIEEVLPTGTTFADLESGIREAQLEKSKDMLDRREHRGKYAPKRGRSRNSNFGPAGGTSHLWQNAAELRNKKFGNSTIGDAGCGPVAATNLLKKLGGRDRALDAMTGMASAYQTADGGTTPDYFEDVLNASGYGGAQTDSKRDILDAVKNGQPTVLLGKSNKENGTPFGAGNHYINALGTDSDGNMIVEDPDLPEPTYKYPIKDVMKDTITGIVSGARRYGYGRFYKPKRATRSQILNGRARSGGDGIQMPTVSKLAEKAYAIIHSHEGNYQSINHNDNGAISIGKIQWHADRARNLIGLIIDYTPNKQDAINALGADLYNEIISGKSWKYRVLTTAQDKKVSAFISTDIGKACQDYQAIKDMDNYLEVGRKLGLQREDALVFYCDMRNQSPKAANRVTETCVKQYGGANVTAQHLYNQCAIDPTFKNYMKRRGQVLAQCIGTAPVGTGVTTIDLGTLHSDVMSASNEAASYASDSSLFSLLSSAFGEIMTKLYGSAALAFLGTSIPGLSTSGTTGGYYDESGNWVGGVGTVGASPLSEGPLQWTKTPQYRTELVNKMKEISIPPDYKSGKVKYSTSAVQDPDKGTASCASTVSWAYRKATGYNPGGQFQKLPASPTLMANDPNLDTIWRRSGPGKFDRDDILKPGDILFYDWDRNNAFKDGSHLGHTEMEGDNGTIWNNGSSPAYGPYLRKMDDYKRRDHLMVVKRLNTFNYWDHFGSTTGKSTKSVIPDVLKAQPQTTSTGLPIPTKQSPTDMMGNYFNPNLLSGTSRRGRRRAAMAGFARSATAGLSSATKNVIKRYGIQGQTNYVGPDNASTGDLEYAQFLRLIIDLLAAIADNTSSLQNFQKSLASKGVNMTTDQLKKIAGNARKKQAGKARTAGGLMGNTPHNSFLDPSDLQAFSQSPTGYIVNAMESLATE